jgi:DNA-binding NarL/FixJ family response regulator
MKPRLLLADDHEVFLEGLRKIVEPYFDVVGAVTDGQQLVEWADRLRPDVVVSDMAMPVLNGIDATRRIRKSHPEIKVVLLTMHLDATYAKAAFEAGASAYVTKHTAGAVVTGAIRESLAGRQYVSPLVDKLAVQGLFRSARRSGADLSPRQRQALQLIAEGRHSKEIAALMGITARTVEFHKQTLLNKLGARNTSDLVRYAVKHGLFGQTFNP